MEASVWAYRKILVSQAVFLVQMLYVRSIHITHARPNPTHRPRARQDAQNAKTHKDSLCDAPPKPFHAFSVGKTVAGPYDLSRRAKLAGFFKDSTRECSFFWGGGQNGGSFGFPLKPKTRVLGTQRRPQVGWLDGLARGRSPPLVFCSLFSGQGGCFDHLRRFDLDVQPGSFQSVDVTGRTGYVSNLGDPKGGWLSCLASPYS